MLLCVGVPCFDGRPYAQTVDALMAEQVICSREGVHLLVQWALGLPYVGVARNYLAQQFLAIKEADAVVMVDADMSWEPGDLLRLARHPHDVIGGTYRPKEPDVRFHVEDCDNKPEKRGDLWKVDGLPGGFLKISRHALETMETRGYLDRKGAEWRDYFPTGFLGGRYRQEDYGFCWQWRQSGGEVWLDPTLKLRHHDGIRHVYVGDAAKWMDETYGVGR